MGLNMVLDQGKCIILKVCAGSYLGFCLKEDFSKDKTAVIYTLVTQDVDSWYEFLSMQGVLFHKKPEINQAFNIYHCFFEDPNGYLIEIQIILDSRWVE
jgi:catechol 2,3-dioxygenase-like lactoylglutathione lyase family enzyme